MAVRASQLGYAQNGSAHRDCHPGRDQPSSLRVSETMKRIPVFVAALSLSSVALCQETPTEMNAARQILTDRAELENSLNLSALVAQVTAADAARDKVVARAKQLMDTELLAMGDDITRHPEIGFKETRSVKILTEYLAKHGFKVEMPVAGLETAFVRSEERRVGKEC